MLRKAILAGAAACALALAGCSAAKLASDINTINAALASPAAAQAAANAKSWGLTIACDVAGAAAQAQTLNAAIKPLVSAKQAEIITRISNVEAIVYTVNATVCGALGGTVASAS
ncbi:hypothetical protein SAMN06265338_1732 [Rhodoblastus acidophilus]|uniref:Lipoprotein n=1 Tax=Rhodoblastus acidophilus TaxID=1074 RepID=A0A212SJ66_RHOAC|nr:hypothetical protein [Rhodoblastus acidophilus]MCW2315330.1 hypothetical protein [Rhodoblastus acidophilus]PPQ40665.1 hypothetical protein CKO16_02735 [Rhodoblastus acidophilus]RAI16228.1 hypothetical protein CH337_22485 [Rhodoblastus acidophilus]SNB85648.1 hypothetical protein SAMN06265338_1732 [Rhodoblastus acidophilus]